MIVFDAAIAVVIIMYFMPFFRFVNTALKATFVTFSLSVIVCVCLCVTLHSAFVFFNRNVP